MDEEQGTCIWCLINRARAKMTVYEGTVHGEYWRSRYEMLSASVNKKTTV